MRPKFTLIALALAWWLGALPIPPQAVAQESLFLPEARFRMLRNEISGDIAYDNLRYLTLYHSPNGGSRDFWREAQWIADRAKEYGLEEVQIHTLPYRFPSWWPTGGELWMVSPEERRLGSFEEAAVSIADNSRTSDVTAELVEVGDGGRDEDYANVDVKGKLVLASGPLPKVHELAVEKRGALGVIYYAGYRAFNHPDQIGWARLKREKPGDKPNTFAFVISARTAESLKKFLRPRPAQPFSPGGEQEGEKWVGPEKVVLHATVRAETREPSTQGMVEAYIRGKRRDLPAIVLTAHVQEEKTSANDDRSGCANVLEIGRAIMKMIREGKMERPQRDLRLWWVNEFEAEYEFFALHPQERGNILADLNQDMVGARQSAGSRIQHVTRTPWSRPSYLNDVVESIVQMVAKGNSAYLAAGQAGTEQPYSKAILARLGTRERYGVEIVPYFGSTDHHVFNDAIVGVPGVTWTNWPDEYIHSTDDDLWQIDRTQLQRNALSVAAVALYLAHAGPADVPALVSEVASGAARRLDGALQTGMRLIAASPGRRQAAYFDAQNLLTTSVWREALALESVRAFSASEPKVSSVITEFKRWVEARQSGLLADLGKFYKALAGAEPPPAPDLAGPSAKEQEMAKKIPELAATAADYIHKLDDLKPVEGLHGLMRFEALNFADGRRSYLEIYRAVRAEAQSAGAWYYGEVSLDKVAEALDQAVKAGMFKVRVQ